MVLKNFYLLVDASIICSYLVSRWIEEFSSIPEFQGTIVKEKSQSEHLLKARKDFHAQYYRQSPSTDDFYQELTDLYPSPEQTERSMIKNYGVAKYPTTGYDRTIFLGDNLNSGYAKEWLLEVSQDSPPSIFVCVTQILKPWWIEITQSQIFNAHTAVLPYARGMYAIENMAIRRDISQFRRAAGTTIHYLDQGVDTGAIIRAQRIVNPFQFDSIWDLKAYSYMLEFDLYTKTVKEMLTDRKTMPAGIVSNPELKGPNFLIKEFTLEKQKQAEESYLWMKSSLE